MTQQYTTSNSGTYTTSGTNVYTYEPGWFITTDSTTAGNYTYIWSGTDTVTVGGTWTTQGPTIVSPPLSSYADPVEELKKRCENLEEWYAEKLSQMIGKIEENEYEIEDLKEEIADLKTTLTKLVDVLMEAAKNG
jgi:ribosomal protein L29